jgi:hypothetical protein
VVLGIPVLGILLLGVASAQSPAGSLQLAAVEVTGAKRYTPAEMVRLSGLAPGTSVTTAHFDAATKLMAATGLFAEINYLSLRHDRGKNHRHLHDPGSGVDDARGARQFRLVQG